MLTKHIFPEVNYTNILLDHYYSSALSQPSLEVAITNLRNLFEEPDLYQRNLDT